MAIDNGVLSCGLTLNAHVQQALYNMAAVVVKSCVSLFWQQPCLIDFGSVSAVSHYLAAAVSHCAGSSCVSFGSSCVPAVCHLFAEPLALPR